MANLQLEMLFKNLHNSRRKESPDDSVRKISSRISIKASSLLYGWSQTHFNALIRLSHFVFVTCGRLETPSGVSKLRSKHAHLLLPPGSFWLRHQQPNLKKAHCRGLVMSVQ
jgi:hypothetical protein